MLIGREQRFHPGYSLFEKGYIFLLGIPVVGLRIRARTLLKLLPERLIPANILDAGSGPGVISFLLAQTFPNSEITGVDTQPEEIDNCRIIAERAALVNTEFLQADILHLTWHNRFQLITCIDILEHIEDDLSALESLRKSLEPGGILLLHVPSKYRRYPVFKKRPNFHVPSHIRNGYEMGEITERVKQARLTITGRGYTFGFLETLANNIGYMITRAERKNRILYAISFPFLNLMGWLGRFSSPGSMGAGIYIIARKDILNNL